MTPEKQTRAKFDEQFREDQEHLNRSLLKVYRGFDQLFIQIDALKEEIIRLKKECDNKEIDREYYKNFYDSFHAKTKEKTKKIVKKKGK